MNKQQLEYVLENHRTQSEIELVRNLQIKRKDLRRELRRILQNLKKDGREFIDGKNPSTKLAPFRAGLNGWLAGKELYFLIALMLLVGMFVFKDFFLLKKVYLYADIGSDSMTFTYPRLIHLSNYLRSDGLPQWSFSQGMGQNIFPLLFADTFFGFLLLLPSSIIADSIFFVEFAKIVLAGILFLFYLRMLSLSHFTSVVGGIMFAFSGYIILGSCWSIFSTEAVLAALLLYAFEKYFVQKLWFLFPVAIALLSIFQPFYLYLCGVFLIIYGALSDFSMRLLQLMRSGSVCCQD